MKKVFLFCILFVSHQLSASAQISPFVESGQITFERKVNTFATMKIFLEQSKQVPEDQLDEFMQNYRQKNPQFWTDSFQLFFDKNRSLYEPVNKDMGFSQTFAIPIAYKNIVNSNFQTGEVTTEKVVFDKDFIVTDSLKHIRWKLTDETREIAGYHCRRANALLFDSIYVVAFYTDQIPTQGGPESFNGLPGMILGVAIPYKHITIFAKTVAGFDPSPDKWLLSPPRKAIEVNSKEFHERTAKMLKDARLTSSWVQFFMDL